MHTSGGAVFDATTVDELAGEPARGRELRPRGRRTMERLLRAASEAVAEDGHQTARVDDVVRRAGLSHGTFYLYFRDMDDVLSSLVRHGRAQLAVLVRDLPHDDCDPRALTVWFTIARDALVDRRELLRAAATLGEDLARGPLGGDLEARLASCGAPEDVLAADMAVLLLVDSVLHERTVDVERLALAVLRVADPA